MALLEMNSGGNGAVLGGEAHWAPGAAAMAYAAAAAVAAGIPAPSGTTPSRAVAAFYPSPPHPAGHQHFTSAQSQFDEYVASNGNNDGDFLSAGYPSSSSKGGAADTNYYSQLFQLRQSEENALRGCGAIPPYEMDTTSIEGKQQGTSAVGGGSFFPQQAYPPPPPPHHQHISAATEWRGSDIYLRVGATLEIGASAHSLMEQNCWLPAHPGHQLALHQHSQQQLAIAGGFSHPHHFQTPPDNDLPGATHQTLFKGNGFKGGPLHVHQQSTGLEGISASHSLALARPIGSQANLEGRMKQQRAPERRSNQQQQSGATRSYACAMCAKQYCRKSTLRAHMKQQHHLGDRPFSCQICGKHFSQAANLAAHRRVHTGEKPFHCPVCHRPFSQSSSLVTHKRTHTGERPYPCPHCDKAFTDSSTLTKHLRTHTGQKPYSCALCMMKFSQSGNLHRHMKTHMNGVMPPH